MSKRQTTPRPLGAPLEGPPSSQPPQPVSERDAAAMAAALVEYHAHFRDLFARREQRDWSAFYLQGQLAPLERKTIEPMVLAARGDDPAAVRAVQQFISEGAWDDRAILTRLETLVAEDLGPLSQADGEGMLIIDGSSFPKQGTHSVGVARQYCGHLGNVANCQHGVFLAYASARGCAFIDRRLYLPQAWFNDARTPDRLRCGVPEALTFETEPARRSRRWGSRWCGASPPGGSSRSAGCWPMRRTAPTRSSSMASPRSTAGTSPRCP